jgi:hypothetical protein
VALRAEDLAIALDIDGNQVGTTLRGLAALMGGSGANLAEQGAVASEFVAAVWREQELVPHRHVLASLLADRLLVGSPDVRRTFSEALFRDPDNALSAFDRAIAVIAAAERPSPAS